MRKGAENVIMTALIADRADDVEGIAFDEGFIERVLTTKAQLERRQWAIWIVITTITITLFASLRIDGLASGINTPYFSGENAQKAKELLVFATTTLLFFSGILSHNSQGLTLLINKVHFEKFGQPRAKILNLQVPEVLGTFFLLDWPDEEDIHLRTYLHFIVAALFFVVLVPMIIFPLTILAFLVILIFEIFSDPSLPWIWSYLAGTYGILAIVSYFAIGLLPRIPLPFTDFGLMKEADKLKKEDPAAHKEFMNQEYNRFLTQRKKHRWIAIIAVITVIGAALNYLFEKGYIIVNFSG